MSMCRPLIKTTLVYHDGVDWVIEQRGEGYWSFPLDGEVWKQGLPVGLSAADMALVFLSTDDVSLNGVHRKEDTVEEDDVDDLIEHVLHLEACEDDRPRGLVVDSFWNVPPFDRA